MSKQLKICKCCKQQTDSNIVEVELTPTSTGMGKFKGYICRNCIPPDMKKQSFHDWWYG